ncbi:LuxR C-terminal-related transcriptional regulator [Phenylobacterium sp.]|uniref:helix-turn-helix transcriptional regulator n=1 Tax=Phenylobacterium sp. TaxID=1871053 RepID=UPI00391CB6FD
MRDDDAFDQRLVRPAQAYARLYPSITARLKAAYDSGHPLVRQIARSLGVEIERAEGAREHHLRDAHRLSPQETRIALHLIDGGSVATCAEALQVAESTVRTHLKSVFAKTGVRRQAELRTLLPPGRS